MTLNFGRITQKRIGDRRVWVARTNAIGEVENAWLVGDALNPDRGLPQPEPECVEASIVPYTNWPPHTPPRPDVMVRGILHDARIAAQARGIVPTLEALEQIGEELLPLVVRRIAELSAPKRGGMAGAMNDRPRARWSTAN